MPASPACRSETLGDASLDALRDTVQCNCHISDARHAGNYSLCIYLLKMREFYRWERRLPLTAPLPRDEVGRWLEKREALWDEVELASYSPLPLFGSRRDPFEADAVNARLAPSGLVYGGGYGTGGKPLFFLARRRREERREGLRVLVTDAELARDLSAPPAMLQRDTVYVRRESLRRFLWEKVEAWEWNRGNRRLGEVCRAYGFADDPETALDRMTDNETETLILHELGEARAGRLLGDDWERMLLDFGRSRAELTARAVRDLLADCTDTLPRLLERDDRRPLDFYLANLDGLRRKLFPALLADAVSDDPDALARTVERGRGHWERLAREILALWRRDGAACGDAVAEFAESRALH